MQRGRIFGRECPSTNGVSRVSAVGGFGENGDGEVAVFAKVIAERNRSICI